MVGKLAARAKLSDAELAHRARKAPADLSLFFTLARRAQARGKEAEMQAWLSEIEAQDRSPGRKDAAQAAWQRTQIELRKSVRSEVEKVLRRYIEKYPTGAREAAQAFAATKPEREKLEAVYGNLIAAAGVEGLNELTYDALGAGAFDAALVAATRQLAKSPKDANSYDTLAEVYNYRGEKQLAVSTQKKGIEIARATPDLASAMRTNLARFERGEKTNDVRKPSLAALLSGTGAREPRPMEPKDIAERFLSHEVGGIGAKCAAKAGVFEEAYVRVKFGKGSRLESVEVLEPSAPAALKQCLEAELKALTVPADSPPVRVVLPIKLVQTPAVALH